jgi:uncharacterized protein with NRDE domain
MCLIVFAYRAHPGYKLILAANRDEFYARPTAPLGFWNDAPSVLAGRDLIGGGTWFGITRGGKFAVVTNYRDTRGLRERAPSRGLLTADFLRSHEMPRTYLEALQANADSYNGFSLLAGDNDKLCYFCNRENVVRELKPSLHGLSNHRLNTPWFKVQRAKHALRRIMDTGAAEPKQILEFLSDRARPADNKLPHTGVGVEMERLFSSIFVSSQDYGTRSSTVLLISNDGRISLTERDNLNGNLRTYHWKLTSA